MLDKKKDSNPKDAVGVRKVPFSVIPWPVVAEAGLGMLEGGRKYGRHNYREVGVRASVYFDGLFRHITAWWEGEDIDADSGLHHVSKAISDLMVLRDSMLSENWVDDRPPKVKNGWIQEFNKRASEIIDKYPNPLEPYTELRKNEKKSSLFIDYDKGSISKKELIENLFKRGIISNDIKEKINNEI